MATSTITMSGLMSSIGRIIRRRSWVAALQRAYRDQRQIAGLQEPTQNALLGGGGGTEDQNAANACSRERGLRVGGKPLFAIRSTAPIAPLR